MISKKENNYRMIMIAMAVIGLIIAVIGMLFLDQPIPWIKGIFFGTTFTILKYMLMKNSIIRILEMPEGKAQVHATVHYIIRYLLTGVVLMVAALEPSISLMGVFIGLLTMKLATYTLLLLGKLNTV